MGRRLSASVTLSGEPVSSVQSVSSSEDFTASSCEDVRDRQRDDAVSSAISLLSEPREPGAVGESEPSIEMRGDPGRSKVPYSCSGVRGICNDAYEAVGTMLCW